MGLDMGEWRQSSIEWALRKSSRWNQLALYKSGLAVMMLSNAVSTM
jgi:hypothetical protein